MKLIRPFRNRNKSLLAGMVVVAFVLLLAPFWKWKGPGLCVFHDLTGLKCPGCGMTRAFYAISHGHFVQAIRLNLLSLPLYITLVGLLLFGIVCLFTNIRIYIPTHLKLERHFGYSVLLLVVTYGVLRNITALP
jgi:hypothetical protein